MHKRAPESTTTAIQGGSQYMPSDPLAERALLGGFMIDPDSLAKVRDFVSESDFSEQRHRAIYRAVTTMADAGMPVDAVTLADWFADNGLLDLVGGDMGYLIDVSNSAPSSANVRAYAEIVVEKSRLRQIMDMAAKLAREASLPGADSSMLAAEASLAMTRMQAESAIGGLVHVKDPVKEFFAEMQSRYEESSKGATLGLASPWKDVNDRLKGFRKKTLYILGARPSMGKSVWGLQVAGLPAIHGNRVAFFSVEMSRTECIARLVSAYGDIPYSWVEQPKDEENSEIYWSRTTTAITTLLKANLFIDDTPALSLQQMMARCRRMWKDGGLDMVVLDHMHDMKINSDRARFEYGDIVQGGKTLAKELDIPVILLAQLNRSAANRTDARPKMSDLRESGEIEQKADVILFLHREDYYDKDTDKKGVVELIPAKGRNIETGSTIYLKNNFSKMRMDDMDPYAATFAEPDADRYASRSRGFDIDLGGTVH